jgi:DNA (cytosine-5)-methyltransferase 1
MKHGSLFSGIGGFDLAAEWMGWENVFHCEWNPFGQRILKHYWPNAKSYHDITKTDFTIHRGQVDIITGGFPCQPFSTAGKRKGTDDARYLWPEMLRVIREVRPTWIIGENVYGLVNWDGGLVFDTVCADLENEGFEVWPVVLPAASVNAPHKRDRVWFVAYNNGIFWREGREFKSPIQPRHRKGNEGSHTKINGIAADTDSDRCKESGKFPINERQNMFSSGILSERITGHVTDTGCEGLERWEIKTSTQSKERKGKQYRNTTRQIPIGWQNFPTVSPICNGNDGLSDRLDGITFSKWRNESIKGGGNAIVPQVALQIFKTIEGMYKHEHMERPTPTT